MGNVISTLFVLLFVAIFLLLKTVGVFDSDEFSLGLNSHDRECLNTSEQNRKEYYLVATQCRQDISVG